jgi:cysteine protease IpaJ
MPKFQYKQTYTNSCGAVCLMCSAKELGVDAFPDAQPWNAAPLVMSKWTETNVFLYTGTPEKKSTGFFSAKVNMPATSMVPDNFGYSMPARIVAVARSIGLLATVYMRPGLYSKVLSTFYSEALDHAKQSGVRIVERDMPPLSEYSRALKVMAVMKGLGLHYVMLRPDGSYMDPGDGKNFDSFDSMNDSLFKSYADTGISIVCQEDPSRGTELQDI